MFYFCIYFRAFMDKTVYKCFLPDYEMFENNIIKLKMKINDKITSETFFGEKC